MSKTLSAILLGAVSVLLLGQVSQVDSAVPATRMDVFITADQAIQQLDSFVAKHPDITLRIHTLDAIETLKAKLSKGLPADPHEANRVALSRLRQLSKEDRAELEHAATSIATAVNYGVMKYPAIVFDSEFVVYGLTDPVSALAHLQRWRRAEG